MSKRLRALLMCAVLLAGCSPVVAPTPPPSSTPIPIPTLGPTIAPTPTLVSTQTSTPTVASTPTPVQGSFALGMIVYAGLSGSYGLTIDADGSVTYERRPLGGTPEKRTTTISPEQIEELVVAINKANIWAIEDQHHKSCMDCAELAVSVTLNGRTKRVLRGDAAMGWCDAPSGATPSPCAVLRELADTIYLVTNRNVTNRNGGWMTYTPTPTPAPSSARVVVTVYLDVNGNGTPEPTEGLHDIPVQLMLPDGKLLSAATQRGVATFDMSGYTAGIQITCSLPNLYRNYQFFLPQSGTVPIIFSFAQPTLPGKTP